jgi:N-acyl-D-aspartate/D-glutamate deacylase
LEFTKTLQDQGKRIYPQVSCRPLNFEFNFEKPFPLESMPLFQRVGEADFAGKMKLYQDPEFRKQWREDSQSSGVYRLRWDKAMITHCPGEPLLLERTVQAVADERGVDPADLLMDLSVATKLQMRIRIPLLNDDEDEVAELLKDENTLLGLSDAGAHASQLCDSCFSTHLLGHWVREKEVLTLEQAVRMLTSRSAEFFGFTDRGTLKTGFVADVVVFDPKTVAAGKLERVYDFPAGADRLISQATGIDAVIVNGVLLREGNRDVVDPKGALPGRLLRGALAN